MRKFPHFLPVALVGRLFDLVHQAVYAALESFAGHDGEIVRLRAMLVHWESTIVRPSQADPAHWNGTPV